jgi:uncharacterized membrane protein
MESKAKLLGHPLHPILITIPLGLFVATLIFDIVALFTGNSTFAEVAFWNLSAGLIGGLVAAFPGAIDWANIPSDTRAKRVGAIHGLGNVGVLALLAVAWWLRREQPGVISTPPFVIELVAIGLAGFTGWLGGELVDRLRVGVDDGAHLNAPNSLSGLPASSQASDTLRERELGR